MSYFPKSAVLVGQLIGANMNSTADQAINILVPQYRIPGGFLFFANASINLTTAAGGIYTGAGKTGTQIIAAATVYSTMTTSSIIFAPTLNNSDRRTESTLYFALTTAQGAAATADLYLFGLPF